MSDRHSTTVTAFVCVTHTCGSYEIAVPQPHERSKCVPHLEPFSDIFVHLHGKSRATVRPRYTNSFTIWNRNYNSHTILRFSIYSLRPPFLRRVKSILLHLLIQKCAQMPFIVFIAIIPVFSPFFHSILFVTFLLFSRPLNPIRSCA